MDQTLSLGIGDRHRLALATEKTGDTRLAGDELPSLVGEFHLDQNIAREKLLLALHANATTHLDHLFGGHHDLIDLMLETVAFSLLGDQLSHLFLRTGENMQDIPTFCHDQRFRLINARVTGAGYPPSPSTNWTTFESTRSTSRKKIAAMVAITKTVMVAVPVSRREAQEIREISWRTCLTNCAGDVFAMVVWCRYEFHKLPATL